MEKKITIIMVLDGGDVEPNTCYRLDDEESAIHCFHHFQNNFERDEEHKFIIKEVTQEEWDEIERVGQEMA